MKKIFILALLLVVCVFLLYKRSTQLVQNTMPADTLFVFVQEGCGHCHAALSYINGTVRSENPDLKVEVLDISDNNNMAKLYVVAKQQNWNIKRLGTPVIKLNNKAFMGWTAKSEKQLSEMIQKLPAKNP